MDKYIGLPKQFKARRKHEAKILEKEREKIGVQTPYQTKISYIWFPHSYKFPKQGNTLRHHFFLSIKMHDL